jgi:hypothetical protein
MLRQRIVWRLLEASAPGAPELLTPRLRLEALENLALQRATELAAEHAQDLEEQAKAAEEGLQAPALQAKLGDPHVTEPIARKQSPYEWSAPSVLLPEDAPGRSTLGRLPPAHNEQAMKAVFELIPEEVGGPYDGRPTSVLTVAPLRTAFILERAGYTPPARDEFEREREKLVDMMSRAPRVFETMSWFGLSNLKDRTGYTPD